MRTIKGTLGLGFILLLVCLATGLTAAEEPAKKGADRAVLKDSSSGGTPLPDGGGEPGKAYMALVNAIYKKDYAQICNLNNIDENTCKENKKGIDGLMGLFSAPKAHKVAGGFMKEDSATLDIIYSWENEQVSKAIVTMKRNNNGTWIFRGFSAHAEQQIEVKVDATTTLDR